MYENNNIEIPPVIDDQQLKLLGLKRTMAYVPDNKIEKATKKNNAERQARFRNKEKLLIETIKDVGLPPSDVVDFVKEHGWIKVGECILFSKKISGLPRFIRWLIL